MKKDAEPHPFFIFGKPMKMIPHTFISSLKQFRIFNRWGELVFDTQDMKIGWDGTYKNEKLLPAVFVYYVDVQCIDGRRTIKKGNITLIR